MNNKLKNIVLLILCLATVGWSTELDELIKEGQESNPSLLAAKWRMEQFLLKHDELMEFYDPSLFVGTGYAKRQRDLPLQTNYTELNDNSADFQAGIEVPVNPGAYVSAGAAQRVLVDRDDYDDVYQTMFGVRVRIPLLKDRGFKALSLNRALAAAEYQSSAGACISEAQNVRHAIELAYIAAYENLCSYRIAQEATKRFQNIHAEALELSRMKVVPEFQTYQTKMDLQVGLEDEENARQKFENSLIELARAVGITRSLTLKGEAELKQAMENLSPLPAITFEEAFAAKGTYIKNKADLQYARVQIDTAIEEQTDNLDLYFGLTAQGEHEENPFGMDDLVSEHRAGGEVAMIWRRSLDYRGPRTRKARYEARIQELKQDLRNIEVGIIQDIASARLSFDAAKRRIELVTEGIAAAQATLASEQERFRLGQTDSSLVTDAQKNLTTVLQRRVTAAAELMRARCNFNFATGYNSK